MWRSIETIERVCEVRQALIRSSLSLCACACINGRRRSVAVLNLVAVSVRQAARSLQVPILWDWRHSLVETRATTVHHWCRRVYSITTPSPPEVWHPHPNPLVSTVYTVRFVEKLAICGVHAGRRRCSWLLSITPAITHARYLIPCTLEKNVYLLRCCCCCMRCWRYVIAAFLRVLCVIRWNALQCSLIRNAWCCPADNRIILWARSTLAQQNFQWSVCLFARRAQATSDRRASSCTCCMSDALNSNHQRRSQEFDLGGYKLHDIEFVLS